MTGPGDGEPVNGSQGPIAVKAGFIGTAEHGPLDATVVPTWALFERTYGSRGDLCQAVRGWFENGGGDCVVARLDPDGNLDPMRRLWGQHDSDGLRGVASHRDLDLIACPGVLALSQRPDGLVMVDLWKALQLELVNTCESTGDRMALLDPMPGMSARMCVDWRVETGIDSAHASLYYPWLRIRDGKRMVAVPPCGHVAGLFAQSASTGGLMKTPANVRLNGALDVECRLSTNELDYLYPLGINPIIVRSRWGVRPWGAHTLSSDRAVSDIGLVRLLQRVSRALVTPPERAGAPDGAGQAAQMTIQTQLASLWPQLTGGERCPETDISESMGAIKVTLDLVGNTDVEAHQAVFIWRGTGPWLWEINDSEDRN